MGIGTTELLIILAVLLLLFGHQLPTLMRSMGRSLGEFKAGMNDPPPPDEDPSKKPPAEK